MKWLTYKRGTVFPNWFTLALLGHQKYSAKLTGMPVVESVIFNNKGGFVFAWGEKKINKLGLNTMRLCNTSRGRKRHFSRYKKIIAKAINAADKIYKIQLHKYSNGELLRLYDNVFKHAALAHGLLNVEIDAFDVVYDGFLQKKLKDNLIRKLNSEEFSKLYGEISVPAYKTYLNQEEEAVLKLALRKRLTPQDIKGIYQRFWWTALGWENLSPHTEKYFSSKVKRARKRKGVEKKLSEIRKQVPEIIKRRTELLKRYNLEKISPWLEFLDQYAYYHEARKEMQMKTNYAFHLIMLEAAKRLGLSKTDLNWLWGDEVKKLLQGGELNKEEISRRKEAILTLINGKGLKIFSGAAAIKKYKMEVRENIESVSEAKGFCAMIGKVRGRAKVCNGLEDALKKIKKGDILICGMTTPDYISVMKKATAIVTDEGGLTCHAAIVSRELKIPCIVGTKIATKIFKDGDLVEVDATRGIVKILK